jgi:predicted nucleic-acid-binding protein
MRSNARLGSGVIAVDTNVVVRLLTQDDLRQAEAARELFASERIWIARTVLLETSWVLQSLYRFEQSAVIDAFTKLLGLENVYAEDEGALATAFRLAAEGVDLADALHLSGRPPGAPFVTFDRAFIRRAERAGVPDIISAERSSRRRPSEKK